MVISRTRLTFHSFLGLFGGIGCYSHCSYVAIVAVVASQHQLYLVGAAGEWFFSTGVTAVSTAERLGCEAQLK